MGFDTDISDKVTKMMSATLLEDIARLHQCTKILLSISKQNQSIGILLECQILTPKNNL